MVKVVPSSVSDSDKSASLMYKVRYTKRVDITGNQVTSDTTYKKYTAPIELKASAVIYSVAINKGYSASRAATRGFAFKR